MKLVSSLDFLKQAKASLEEDGFVLIPGDRYRAILALFGASEADLRRLESGAVHDRVPRDKEPTMKFRQIAFHRVLLDQKNGCKQSTRTASLPSMVHCSLKQSLQSMLHRELSSLSLASCEASTQIPKEEICSDRGAKVYFERSGSRKWSLPPEEYVGSTVPQAMATINDFLQPSVHHPQANTNADSSVTINDQLLIRVNRGDDEDDAEPTPEGIHQDGTEISSVTLVRRENVMKGAGGESRIWDLKQPTGNYDSPEFGKLEENPSIPAPSGFDWDNCLLDKALESPWETIVFKDREVKHEARAFFREDASKSRCYRDVIVNFVRKPLSDGSDEMIEFDGALQCRRSSIV